MNQYYLLAQLPAFNVSDDKAPLPITEEYFNDLCSRFLDKKSLSIVEALSLEPPRTKKSTGSSFVDEWYEKERALRVAMAEIRAVRMKKKFEIEGSDGASPVSPEIIQAARTACSMDSPLSAEQYLNSFRASIIDNIKLSDAFSTDAVFAYGLKLKLASRMKKFNAETGLKCYHSIYDRILNASGETK